MLTNIAPDLSVDPGSRIFDRDTLTRNALIHDGSQGMRPLPPEDIDVVSAGSNWQILEELLGMKKSA